MFVGATTLPRGRNQLAQRRAARHVADVDWDEGCFFNIVQPVDRITGQLQRPYSVSAKYFFLLAGDGVVALRVRVVLTLSVICPFRRCTT